MGAARRQTGFGVIVAGLVAGLAGCSPQVAVRPLGLHAVPVAEADGWRVDAYVEVEVSVPGPDAVSLVAEQFVLVTSAGDVACGPAPSALWSSGGRQAGNHSYDALPLLRSRRFQPNEPATAWLAFPNVLRIEPFEPTDAGRAVARAALFDGLARLRPELAFQVPSGTTMLSLEAFTTLPDRLALRDSDCCDHVKVIDFPNGLSGFQLAGLDARMTALGLGAGDRVVLRIDGPMDPCLAEWWSGEPATPTAPSVGLARVCPATYRADPMACLTAWYTMTRRYAMPVMVNEPQAVAKLLDGEEQEALLSRWRTGDDARLRQVAAEEIRQASAVLAPRLLAVLANDPEVPARRLAAQQLAALEPEALAGQRKAIAAALAIAVRDPDRGLRHDVLEAALAQQCPEAVLGQAKVMLKSPADAAVACRVIGAAKDRFRRPTLEKMANSGSREAAAALLQIDSAITIADARGALRRVLEGKPRATMGDARPALQVIAQLGGPAEGALVARLWDDQRPVDLQLAMLQVMRVLGGEAALNQILVTARSTPDETGAVRREALQSLEHFGDERAIPVLEQFAPNRAYRDICLHGLVRIGGPAAAEANRRLATGG